MADNLSAPIEKTLPPQKKRAFWSWATPILSAGIASLITAFILRSPDHVLSEKATSSTEEKAPGETTTALPPDPPLPTTDEPLFSVEEKKFVDDSKWQSVPASVSPQTEDKPLPEDLTFQAEWKGDLVFPQKKRNVVIRSQKTWKNLWNTVHKNQKNPPKTPSVDFNQSIVVGHFAGEKPFAGCDIKMRSMTLEEKNARVRFVVSAPSAAEEKDRRRVWPYRLWVVDKTDLPVKFTQDKE